MTTTPARTEAANRIHAFIGLFPSLSRNPHCTPQASITVQAKCRSCSQLGARAGSGDGHLRLPNAGGGDHVDYSVQMSIVLDELVAEIELRLASRAGHLIVGVDGPDGAGKTVLAGQLRDGLARTLDERVVLVNIDNFHLPRAVRYQLGTDSPVGFFEHSYDYDGLRNRILDPVRASSGKQVAIVPGSHDLETDQFIDPPALTVPEQSVVIVEGILLHRDEVFSYLDYSIFLDVPFSETARRMSIRDGSVADPEHPSMTRYVEGQRIYFRTSHPAARADVVLDNSQSDGPRLLDPLKSHAFAISSAPGN
jgi:uridine kinase